MKITKETLNCCDGPRFKNCIAKTGNDVYD